MMVFVLEARELTAAEISAVSGGGVIADGFAAVGAAIGSRFGPGGAAVGGVAGAFVGRQVEKVDGAEVANDIGSSTLRDRVASGV